MSEKIGIHIINDMTTNRKLQEDIFYYFSGTLELGYSYFASF